jgi:hypothetical protein
MYLRKQDKLESKGKVRKEKENIKMKKRKQKCGGVNNQLLSGHPIVPCFVLFDARGRRLLSLCSITTWHRHRHRHKHRHRHTALAKEGDAMGGVYAWSR